MSQLSQRLGFDLADAFPGYGERLPDVFERNNFSLRDKVRGDNADEFAGCDDLGLLPEVWEMPLVPCDQVVGAGGVRAFQELVVVGIIRNLNCTRRLNQMRMAPYELEKLLPKASADIEFRTREHFPVFRKNGIGDVEPGRLSRRKHENGALESVRFQSCRHQDIAVNYKPERDHRRFGFCLRAALMISSMRRELSLSVPLRRDSSPISLSTSGSGAARRT